MLTVIDRTGALRRVARRCCHRPQHEPRCLDRPRRRQAAPDI